MQGSPKKLLVESYEERDHQVCIKMLSMPIGKNWTSKAIRDDGKIRDTDLEVGAHNSRFCGWITKDTKY